MEAQGAKLLKACRYCVVANHGVVSMLHLHNTLNSKGVSRRTHLLQVVLSVNKVYSGLQYLLHQPTGCKLHNTQPHSAKHKVTKEG